MTSGRRKAASRGHHGFGDRRGDSGAARGYPRSARVNEILREVLADELERMEDTDERFGLLTITAVQCEPDLRHALVFLSSMNEEEEEALLGVPGPAAGRHLQPGEAQAHPPTALHRRPGGGGGPEDRGHNPGAARAPAGAREVTLDREAW